MEPKRGGIIALIGAIILLLSVPFAISLSLTEIYTKYGLSLTLEQMLARLHDVSVWMYIVTVFGIAFNIILGVLLALFSVIIILQKRSNDTIPVRTHKSNNAITVLVIIGGVVGLVSSLLIGGIVGAIGAILVVIGGGIANSTKFLASGGILCVAEGKIEEKNPTDWIFCENKFIIVHSTIGIAVLVGLVIALLTLIVGVNLNINMYIGGMWVAAVSLIAAWAIITIQRNKRRRKFQYLSPDQILNAHPKNFAISYSDITDIRAEQTRFGTIVTFIYDWKEGRIVIRRNELEFEQARNLLTKLFGDKISFI